MASSIDISVKPVVEPNGTTRRLLQDWLILAKRAAEVQLNRPILAERVDLSLAEGAHYGGHWDASTRTVAISSRKVARILSVLTGSFHDLKTERERVDFREQAGMDASGLLHEFVHAALPETARHEFTTMIGPLSHSERREALAFHEAVVQAETLQLLRPWAIHTGLEARLPGVMDLASEVYSYAGMVEMLHTIVDATGFERRAVLNQMIGLGGGPVALETLSESLLGGQDNQGSYNLRLAIGREMLALRDRWDAGQGGLPPDGKETAGKIIARRDRRLEQHGRLPATHAASLPKPKIAIHSPESMRANSREFG